MSRKDRNDEKLTAYNILVICCIGLGSVSFGYAGSVIGTLLGQPSFIEYFRLDSRPNATQLESTMTSIYQAGAVVGSLCQPTIADKWGRRWALAVPAVLMIISGAVMTASTNVAMFITFRFFSGAAALMLASGPPLFMSEIVPSHFRGGLVELHAVFFQAGYVISAWVGYGVFFWKNSINAWRVSLALQCLAPILMLCVVFVIPESPRWLLMQDRVEDARRVLEKIHEDSDVGHEQALAQLHHIQIQCELDRRLGSSWIHVFANPSYRKRFLLGLSSAAISQFSGALVISTYGTVIYSLLSYDSERQLLFEALWLTAGIVSMSVGPFLIDKVPRNRMLAIGMLGCAAVLSILAAIIANFGDSQNKSALKAGLAMVFLYLPFYSLCIDGPLYVFLTEIYPNHLRAKGVCSGTAMMALLNILWLQLAKTALDTIGWKYFLVFIITGFLGGVLIWALWPDTRGMPLEEISALFGDTDQIAVDTNDLMDEKGTDSPRAHVENA